LGKVQINKAYFTKIYKNMRHLMKEKNCYMLETVSLITAWVQYINTKI